MGSRGKFLQFATAVLSFKLQALTCRRKGRMTLERRSSLREPLLGVEISMEGPEPSQALPANSASRLSPSQPETWKSLRFQLGVPLDLDSTSPARFVPASKRSPKFKLNPDSSSIVCRSQGCSPRRLPFLDTFVTPSFPFRSC